MWLIILLIVGIVLIKNVINEKKVGKRKICKIITLVLFIVFITGVGFYCMEIKNIVSEAEKEAFDGDYEAAVFEIEKGLEIYSYSPKLKQKNNEYTEKLNEAIKIKVIEEAKALADKNEFEAAISRLQAAQEIYGNAPEYETVYREYKKMYALSEAKICFDNGKYADAVNVIITAQKEIENDIELLSAYNLYCEKYVEEIITKVDELNDQKQYSEAIDMINAGLKILPKNEKLQNKFAMVEAKKPISITTITELNSSYWYWNEEDPKDPFGNDYSQAANYFVHRNNNREAFIEYRVYHNYDTLTGTITPHADIGENYTGAVQVYADNVLVYNSPTVEQKTDAFDFSVDIAGAEYIKIVVKISDVTFGPPDGKILLADIQLWPIEK